MDGRNTRRHLATSFDFAPPAAAVRSAHLRHPALLADLAEAGGCADSASTLVGAMVEAARIVRKNPIWIDASAACRKVHHLTQSAPWARWEEIYARFHQPTTRPCAIASTDHLLK